jgi:hypothetical protein
MTCRHAPGDTDCSKHPYNRAVEEDRRTREETARVKAETPDASNYTIVDVHRDGPNLVLKVVYPNCRKCSYEGHKVLVFLNVTEAQALRWRTIDPHFRDPKAARSPTEAPGPVARFPASVEGWKDAIAYVESKRVRV